LDFEDAYTDSDTVIWLGKFLQRRRILKIKIKGSIDMPAGKEPMTMLCEESCLLYIHAESVRGFAIVYENEKISKNEMIDRMRRLHFRRKNITLNWGGNRTTRSYWHRDVDLCKAFMPTNPKFIEQEQEEEVNA